MDAWRLWPKLLVTLPEKRCGKSTLLEVVEVHAARGLMTANVTAASLFRCIAAWQPTLLIDEADRCLRDDAEANGIINARHTRGTARVIRVVEIDQHEPLAFSVWGAQAIASIGSQMHTLEDRSIKIGLRRRLATETVHPLPVEFFEHKKMVRRRFARWGSDNACRFRDLDLEFPVCGSDRAKDNWTPLLRIAAILGDPWPKRVSAAYLLKETSEGDRDEPAGVVALRDVMALFEERGADRLQSADLVAAMIGMEDRPWPDWKRGRPMTASSLSRLLKPFGIKPHKIRARSDVAERIPRSPVEAAFARYCANPSPQTGTSEQLEKNGLSDIQAGTEARDVPA